jgi:PAS domain S-box-containing protein
MRNHDWLRTPLGAPETWPQPLSTLVGVMLGSKQPMFLAWGPERTLLYNDGYAGILGRKHPDALGQALLDVWSEIRGDLQPLVDQVDAGESVHMDDIALLMQRHGYVEEAHFAFSYTPVRDDDGRVCGIFCPCQETTQQVIATRREVADRERLEQLFHRAPGFMALLRGPEHVFELVNPAYLQLIGHRDVIGKPVREALPEVEGQGFFELLDQVYATGQAFTGNGLKVGLQRTADSLVEDRFVDLVYQPITDGENRVTGIFAEGSDVTERLQAESALREREERLRIIVESAKDHAIFTMDPEGTITSWSAGAEPIFGWTSEETIGRSGSMIFNREDLAKGLDKAELTAARRKGYTADERWHVRKDGRRVYLSGSVHHLLDAQGASQGFLKIARDETSRRFAADALKESETNYRHAAELNPQVAWTAAPDGQLDRVAERWREWTGTSGLGDTWRQGLHVDDLAHSVEAWTHSVTTGLPYDVEHRVKLQTGEYRWARSRAYPRRDGEGRVVKWYGWTEDIHEQKQAEERLRESELRFRAITDSVDQMIWSTLPDGYHDYYNQRWYDYTGVAEASTDGEAWNDVFHPDDREHAWALWRLSLETGEPYRIEYRLRHRSGEYRWVLGRANAVRDRSGRITRWFGTCTDIQEIVEAREVLARSRQELEEQVVERTRERDQLWDLSEDLLAVASYDGQLLRTSPSWTRLLRHSEETLLTRPYGDLIHPDDLAATMEALLTMRSSGRPASFENRVLAEQGNWHWISWTVSPEPGGERLIAVGRDVTAEKEQAAALRQAEEQLRQAQKMEAVGQLTGGIAHDFNNLLTGVIGSLEMMQRRISQGRPGEIERYATAAMTSANRAAALTHRLLAFARRQPLDPKPVNSNRLVAGMEELLRRTIGEAIRLEIVTAGGLWQTLCDPNQLESAILNLAINARDAMPEGGTLTIETCNAHLDSAYAAGQRDVRPGQYVCICVTDTGTGMSADVIAKAFEPFFTTKPIGQGTGLGLSMIYGFARQSEGYAKIYSEPGQGTTVKLYLPRYYGEAEGADEGSPALPATPRAEHGEVVLVVEDETAVRDLVVDVLQDLGYRAIEAADGLSGLKLLQSDLRVDLLVTDVGLPGLNGRQLADAARTRRPDLKVLFMTGYAENATIANGFLEPRMQIITKPFAIEALATRIRDMIEGG